MTIKYGSCAIRLISTLRKDIKLYIVASIIFYHYISAVTKPGAILLSLDYISRPFMLLFNLAVR